MLIDLDHFKTVNDTFGHAVGDAVLVEVAARWARDIPGGAIARLGGDEFAVAHRVKNIQEAETIAKTVAASVLVPYDVIPGGAPVIIGVAICPDHGNDSSALLKLADKAMYRAKHKYHVAICDEAGHRYLGPIGV